MRDSEITARRRQQDEKGGGGAVRHPTRAAYTRLRSAHAALLPRTDHVLNHKTNVNKCKRAEIIQRMFSNQNRRQIEINDRNKFEKFTNGSKKKSSENLENPLK